MAGKMAISYYWELMSDGISDIKIHNSGIAAVEQIERDAKHYFQMPVISKKKLRLTKNGAVTIGFGFRYLRARFLDDDEIAIYKKYGDETCIEFSTEKLIAPTEGTE